MRRRSTLLLNIAIALSLTFSGILSGLLIPTPVAMGTSSAPAVAPGEVSPEPASRKVKRERKHDRKQKDRKQDRKKKDNKQDRKKNDRQQDRKKDRKKGEQQIEQIRVGNWEDQCTGPNTIRLKKSELCTHGPDPAPPGFDVNRPVKLLSAPEARQMSASIVCEDDGETGFRVQVIYVRGPSSLPMSAPQLVSILGWVGDMDVIFRDSAEETGPARNLRFVQDPITCEPIVEDVEVTNDGLLDFDAMIAQLENQEYNRTDRIYLSFVNADEYCGIGTLWEDDDVDGTFNWNNLGPSHARVDSGCWDGATAAHEVMHNLGGVQLSAFNSSGGFHCVDEYDIMCYSDDPFEPPMREVCLPEAPLDETLLDCNHDDYYNTNPAGGSYLANFWNPADNRFLIGAPDTPLPDDMEDPTVEWIEPVGNDEQLDVSAGTIGLEAAAADNVGVERVEFWRYDNEDEEWVFLSEDFAPPYQSSINVSALSLGVNELSADAYDETRNWSYESIFLNRVNATVAPPTTGPPPTTTDNDNDNDKDKKKKKKKKGKKKKKR